MTDKEFRIEGAFLVAFFVAIILFKVTTLNYVWVLIPSSVIFFLLAISVDDENKDQYKTGLSIVIGIAIAFIIFGRYLI